MSVATDTEQKVAYVAMPRKTFSPRKARCSRCDLSAKQQPCATIYCPDCVWPNRFFCDDCAVREHHVGSRVQFHSLERISTYGVHVITPLIDFLLLPLISVYLFWHIGIPSKDYAYGEDVCPTVRSIRAPFFAFDAAFASLLKSVFAYWCAAEDGYWRLYMDAWARGVVSSSDSLALILATLPRALIFRFTVERLLLVPVLSLLNAIICTFFHVLEGVQAVHPRASDALLDKAPVVWSLIGFIHNVTDTFVSPDMRVPLTYPRKRRSMNFLEGAAYTMGRKLRVFASYYYGAAARVSTFFTVGFLSALLFRLICVAVDAGAYVRGGLSRVGLPDISEGSWSVTFALSGSEPSSLFLHAAFESVILKVLKYTFWLLMCLAVVLVPLGGVLYKQTKAFTNEVDQAEKRECQAYFAWWPDE